MFEQKSFEELDLPVDNLVKIKVSAAMCHLPFNGCNPEFIRAICKSSCCDSSTRGTLIVIHPTEENKVRARGGIVTDGLLQANPITRQCPFKTEDYLCNLHDTPDKPFGCIASPFTLNANRTLIIRNRYKLLRCFKTGYMLPAYKAFRPSLDLLFGYCEAERICKHLDNGNSDLIARMSIINYQMLIDNDSSKHQLLKGGRQLNCNSNLL